MVDRVNPFSFYRTILVFISILAVSMGPIVRARPVCPRLLEPGRVYPSGAPSSLVEFAEEIAVEKAPDNAVYAGLRPVNTAGRVMWAARELTKMGVGFEKSVEGRFRPEPVMLEILPHGASRLNRVSQRLKELYGISVRFDPREIPHMSHDKSASNPSTKIIYLSENAALTGRPDRAFYNEVHRLIGLWREEKGERTQLNGWYRRPKKGAPGWLTSVPTEAIHAFEAAIWEQDYLATRNIYKALLKQPHIYREDLEIFAQGVDFKFLGVLSDLKYLNERARMIKPEAWRAQARGNGTIVFLVDTRDGLRAEQAISRAFIDQVLPNSFRDWTNSQVAEFFNQNSGRDKASLVLTKSLQDEGQRIDQLFKDISEEKKRVSLMRSSFARGLNDAQIRAVLRDTFETKRSVAELVEEWSAYPLTTNQIKEIGPPHLNQQTFANGLNGVREALGSKMSHAPFGEIAMEINGLKDPLLLRWSGGHFQDVLETLSQVEERGLAVEKTSITALLPHLDQQQMFLASYESGPYIRAIKTPRDQMRAENQARVIRALKELNLEF